MSGTMHRVARIAIALGSEAFSGLKRRFGGEGNADVYCSHIELDSSIKVTFTTQTAVKVLSGLVFVYHFETMEMTYRGLTSSIVTELWLVATPTANLGTAPSDHWHNWFDDTAFGQMSFASGVGGFRADTSGYVEPVMVYGV